MQNRDHGWPTFCRGWGALPFDRSAADISAHVLRALMAWRNHPVGSTDDPRQKQRVDRAVTSGFQFLAKAQRSDGTWLPLWFGNQFAANDENPTYGTARVLAAYRDADRLTSTPAQLGLRWLEKSQNPNGGWGGNADINSSVEETALVVELLASVMPDSKVTQRGLTWLIKRVEAESHRETTPIGFISPNYGILKDVSADFVVAALRRALCAVSKHLETEPSNRRTHESQPLVATTVSSLICRRVMPALTTVLTY